MTERENLFAEMNFFEALKLYIMGFVLKLKFSLRLFGVILIALVLIFGIIGLATSLNYVKNSFSEQANNITNQ
jgi:Zn-dependent membrane protease YugP